MSYVKKSLQEIMHNCQNHRTSKVKFITSVVMQPGTCYSKRHTMITMWYGFRIKVWEQIQVLKQKLWKYMKRLLSDFGTYSCVILLVCWHLILSDGVYFDDFDIETGHGINVTEEEKAHGPTGTLTQQLSHTMRALEPDDRPVTIYPCLNRFIPGSGQNRAGTNERRLSLCCWQSEHQPTMSHQISWGSGGGGTLPDQDSNPGPFAYRASTPCIL